MAPFYGWGSTASRLEPLRGGKGSLPSSTPNSALASSPLGKGRDVFPGADDQIMPWWI